MAGAPVPPPTNPPVVPVLPIAPVTPVAPVAPVAPVTPVAPSPKPKLHKEPWFKGIIIATALAIAINIVVSWIMNHPSTKTPNLNDTDLAQMLFDDAAEFHRMYWGWTVVDWALTFLGAGTAVAATMKNTYSVQQGQAEPSWLDKTLMALAILAVLASTFDAKLHASQLAVEYRLGDLTMQRAKMDWANSAKDAAAKKDFLDQWKTAENYLQPSTINTTPQTTPPQSGGNANAPDANKGTTPPPATTPSPASK